MLVDRVWLMLSPAALEIGRIGVGLMLSPAALAEGLLDFIGKIFCTEFAFNSNLS